MMYTSKQKKYFIPLFFIVVASLLSIVVMFLWNAILPDLFHFPEISFWQALGLLILSRVLFGAGHFKHPAYSHFSLHEKWAKMTPEERDEFRKRMSYRHYHWQSPPCSDEKNDNDNAETI